MPANEERRGRSLNRARPPGMARAARRAALRCGGRRPNDNETWMRRAFSSVSRSAWQVRLWAEAPDVRRAALSGRPVSPAIRSRRSPPGSAGRLWLGDRPDGSSAQKQRLDDLGGRPVERPAAREALLAQRIFAREPKHQPSDGAVYRCDHRLQPCDFLRHPTPTTRFRVPGRERAVIGLVHELSGEVEIHVEQGLVPTATSGGAAEYRIGKGSWSLIRPVPHANHRQIFASIALSETDFRANDVANERVKTRVGQIAPDEEKPRDDVGHDRLVDPDFAGYAFSVDLSHGRTGWRTIQNAMGSTPQAVM